jgi:hypothetical protein
LQIVANFGANLSTQIRPCFSKDGGDPKIKRGILGVIFALVLVLSFSPMIPVPASADPAVYVTPAAGGGAISADTSAGAPGQAWTTLGPITIAEGAPTDVYDGIFILTIPSGFEFNIASAPDVAIMGLTPELQADSPAGITATTITVTVTAESNTEADTMTIGGVTPIQVRPTAGTPLASGNINMTAGIIVGVTGISNFGTLNEVAGAVNTLTIVAQPSDTLVGVAIAPPVQVRAVDQFVNSIAGQNIAVALIAGSGTLSGTSPRATNASGIATFNDLSIDTAGPGKVLRFSADGRTVDSNPFNILVAGITVNPTSGLVTTEAGGSDNFTVVLDSQPSDNVTIALSSDDLSEGMVSPTSLTFTTTDWNTPQTVTITGVDDATVDGNVAYTIITAPATSTDPNYNGVDASDVAVTNTDDDSAGITVNPTSGLVTTEAGGTDTFTVVLDSQPSSNVTVGLSSDDSSEGTVAPSSLTFTPANWNTPQTATVTGVDDFIIDGNVAYNIVTAAATSSDANYNGINSSDVAVTNTDDDSIPPATAAPRVSPNPPRPLNPAQMSVQYLSINPRKAYTNQPVTVTTNVVNTGDEASNYNVVLKINGQLEQTKMVSVGPQGTQPVKFTVTKAQPGTYTVSIGRQQESFAVLGSGTTAKPSVNGGMIAISIVAVLVIMVSALLILRLWRPTY